MRGSHLQGAPSVVRILGDSSQSFTGSQSLACIAVFVGIDKFVSSGESYTTAQPIASLVDKVTSVRRAQSERKGHWPSATLRQLKLEPAFLCAAVKLGLIQEAVPDCLVVYTLLQMGMLAWHVVQLEIIPPKKAPEKVAGHLCCMMLLISVSSPVTFFIARVKSWCATISILEYETVRLRERNTELFITMDC